MTETREATYQERATWGDCPVCHAGHGEWCRATGIPLGTNINGVAPVQGDGAHLGRLQNAPTRVRLVAA